MRNIVFLLRYFPSWGGGETVTITLANEMVNRGYNVYILYFEKYEKGEPPYVNKRVHPVKLTSSGVSDRRLPGECSMFLRNNSIDVVVNQWWPARVAYESCRGNTAKLVKCWHMPVYSKRKLEWRSFGDIVKLCLLPVYRIYERRRQLREIDSYLVCSDRLVFLSESFLTQYASMTKLNVDGKCCAIPNPLPYFASAGDNVVKNKTVIVVARMDEQHKKISRVLKVWRNLQECGRTAGWTLKIVGDGPDLEYYKGFVRNKGISGISFEGFQNPVPYYKEAAIFLMTSAKEGFGMTLIEALHFGTIPIVMDTFLSLHDIIIDGQNGFITPDADIDAFAEKLMSVMSDDKLRRRMIPVCMKSAEKFSVRKVVDKWDEMLESL